MKKSLQSGFTLIELLVVIAIIGLLAAIVLVSVGTARSKGIDAAVKGQLGQIRSQAELYASNTGNSYSGMCASAAGLTILNGAASSAGIATSSTITASSTAGALGTKVTCHDSSGAWAAEAPLSGGANNWCVDSTGAVGRETSGALAATGFTCVTPLGSN